MYKLKNSIDYPGKGIITDEQVYQLVRMHSTLFDRLNGRKMLEMSFSAQLMLMGVIDIPAEDKWKFYNKKGEKIY